MMSKMNPDEKFVDIGDTIIHYLLYEGDGPSLVMLHATGFLPWLWHPIARELAGKYRIICPYFCNHRSADPEKGGISWMLLAEDLVNLCRCLKIDIPYMIGHSMGGALIAIAAGRSKMAIKKAVLVEPILLPREIYKIPMSLEDHPLAGKSINRRNSWKDTAQAKAYLNSKPLFKVWDEEMLDLYVAHGMVRAAAGLELACHPRREAALFMGSMGYDPWPVLPDVKCPVLVLEGEHSENKGFIDFKKIAAAFPNGRHTVVQGAGHLIPMEKPKKIISILRSFFRY